MFRNRSLLRGFFWKLLFIGAWHWVVFVACVHLPASMFDPHKRYFQPQQWERGGRWYREKLKIQLWKDKVPQYIKCGGFSKAHLDGVSADYLDAFILETCRAEWMHLANCLCAAVLVVSGLPWHGLVLAGLVLLGNLPFAVIQRYNRFRLQALRARLVGEGAQGKNAEISLHACNPV